MPNHITFPAEWHSQDAILITWPHKMSAWQPTLPSVRETYIDLTSTLSHHQDIIIQLHTSIDLENLLVDLAKVDTNLSRCHFVRINSNDTWARDHGPISVTKNGRPHLLDFKFNGWGNKFESHLDNNLNQQMRPLNIFPSIERVDWVFEGGSIESDGQGTLLTTTQCLLNTNRNGTISRKQVEQKLAQFFGSTNILWLTHGELAGDDTDAHIDTLARFAPNDAIIYQGCRDDSDEHYSGLNAMKKELESFRNRQDQPYRLYELPLPKPKYAADGHRLPATYANFLITNKLVLVPTYEDPSDEIALNIIRSAFPDHSVTGIPSSPLIEEHGSLHCITMQLSKGTVNFKGSFALTDRFSHV